MASNQPNLEKLYERLTIGEEDDEDNGIIVGAVEEQNKKESFLLVGRFLTEKNINFQAMQNVLASLWRPKEGMEVHDIGGYIYSFVFYHVLDLRKVMEGGPWSFEQNMLVYHQIHNEEDPSQVALNVMNIWVQIHGIPKGFILEFFLESIGNFVGKYVKSDPASFDGTWRQYVRIRVQLDVQKPLKRRMKIKREGGSWNWVNFKYERMENFCFVCGIIGHTERECNVVYAHPEKEVERAYGTWLRAQNRGGKQGVGARWLRSTDTGGRWAEAGGVAGNQGTGGNSSGEAARFKEIEKMVRENKGDNFAVVITPRNQGSMDNEGNNLSLSEKSEIGNTILDTKRKRMEMGYSVGLWTNFNANRCAKV